MSDVIIDTPNTTYKGTPPPPPVFREQAVWCSAAFRGWPSAARPPRPFCALRSMIASIPNFVRPLLAWVLRNVVGDERKASILGWVGG